MNTVVATILAIILAIIIGGIVYYIWKNVLTVPPSDTDTQTQKSESIYPYYGYYPWYRRWYSPRVWRGAPYYPYNYVW